MAGSAANLRENLLSVEHGALDFRIVGHNLPRNLEHCLIYGGSRDISASEFVDHAVAIWVAIHAKALRALHAVVLVEGVVDELPQ